MKFGNKEFRNLQEQVLKNANDILEILQSLGSALPNPIAGPQGPSGPQGPKGSTGARGTEWTVGSELPASAREGDIHLKFSGEVYRYENGSWVLKLSIKGPQGPQGTKGNKGDTGAVGPQGEQGPQGTLAPVYVIQGVLDGEAQLPDPSTVPTNYAYVINDMIYGVIGGQWTSITTIGSYDNASEVSFVPTQYVLSTNVQSAIAEVGQYAKTLSASDISYDNTDSGLDATNVQEAIDENASDISQAKHDIGEIDNKVDKRIRYTDVESSLSTTSKLPVQNKIITNTMNILEDEIDINKGDIEGLKSVLFFYMYNDAQYLKVDYFSQQPNFTINSNGELIYEGDLSLSRSANNIILTF